jgi:hypothetical protein
MGMDKYLIGVAIIAALILLIFVWLMISYAHEHVKRHGVHRIVGRSLSGRPTNGKRHTNASFWRKSDGLVIGHPVGRVSKRHHRAGVSNLARMVGWITALIVFGIGMLYAATITIVGFGAALAVYLGYKAIRLVIQLREWFTHRTYIVPMAEALAPRIGITGPELESSIHMEPGYMDKKLGVLGRIDLPPRFHADGKEQESITSLINSRLPVPADLTFSYKGRAPHILIHAAPELPSIVQFRDYVGEIERMGKGKYLAGITRTGDGYIAEFDGEDPHHGYCWGSGRGKSTILKSVIAQTVHNDPDAGVTIADPKEVSLAALKGVPGITFFDDIEDFETRIPGLTPDDWEANAPHMWGAARSVYLLMKARFAELKADPSKEFPVHLFVMEEANSFAVMSSAWWKKNKPKGMSGVTPPFWSDYIGPIFWRGRQVNIKIILVAQTIQERFLGNINLRPSLGMISLSGYKTNQWQNYIGTNPIPKVQRGKGRAIYVASDSETWVQTLLASDQEFRDFAMAGRRPLIVPDTSTVEWVTETRNAPLTGIPLPRGTRPPV